jgi:hypothetical protein
MNLISIDPGHDTGWALWERVGDYGCPPMLAACGVCAPDELIQIPVSGRVQRLVVEWPVACSGKGVSSPYTLVGMCRDALIAVSSVAVAHHIVRQPELVEAAMWKAHTSKPKRAREPYDIATRGALLLTDSELAMVSGDIALLVDTNPKPIARKKSWDLWDAIGLGLWALGRGTCGLTNAGQHNLPFEARTSIFTYSANGRSSSF